MGPDRRRRPALTATTRPAATLVLLHGHDDEPTPIDLGAHDPTATWTVITPSGPVATSRSRHAWWRTDDDGAPVASDVDAATAIVDEVIREHAAAGPVVLGGFSQGGALALALTVRPGSPRTRPVAGSFAVGAWLPLLPGVDTDLTAAAARATPVLVAHGRDDGAVDLLLGRAAAKALHRAGVPVTFVEQDVGHELAPFVAPIAGWAARVVRGEVPLDPP